MGDVGGTRHGPAGRDRMARARSAARHAEQLYPGALGRLVAHELMACAESGPHGPVGSVIVESVITELLDRTPLRATG